MADNTPINQLVDALPESNITTMTLNALDFIVPGEWVNDTNFEAMVRRQTGATDQRKVDRVIKRAVKLYNDPENNYQKALRVFTIVDTVDKVVAATAMASKIGQKISFLSFLDKFTPKADTTQGIDAGLKLVGEIVAFFFLNGIPRENIGAFVGALGNYGKADLMRLSSWVVIDGLIPLGPDFLKKIVGGVDEMSSNNKLFSALSSYLPGDSVEEKKGFITGAVGQASGWVTGFVEEKGLTQDLVVSKVKGVIDVADSGLDYLAAALDASTDYFSHTGTQTVARYVIDRAWKEVQAEGSDDAGDDGGGFSAPVSSGGGTSRKVKLQAFLEAMTLAAVSDGELGEDEEEMIYQGIMSLPQLKNRDERKIRKRLKKTIDRIQDDGFEAVMVGVVTALPEYDDRVQAFALAATIQFSDGESTEDEENFMYDFGATLGISRDDADEILDDMASVLDDSDWEDDDDDW